MISNASGSAVRSDLNNALSAIVTQNSGSSEPTTTYAYMKWADTTAGVMKMRNAANNAWITLHQLDGEYSTIPLENGTAGAPSLYFKDSGTDTGIYSPGADQIGFSTGGALRVMLDTSGRLGIGTSSPTALLHVNGDAIISGNASIPSVAPPGTVQFFAGSAAPTGWLKANGAAVSRSTYSSLFAAIGTTYGAGDGSTTFALPDLRGEFVRCWDDSRGIDSGRGIGSWQTQNYQSHGHGVNDPGHQHVAYFDINQGGDPTSTYAFNGISQYIGRVTSFAETRITIQNSGGTETRPRNIALLAIIKF